MSMISDLVDRLRVESKSMGKYGKDYMATLLMKSADTIEMLSEKVRETNSSENPNNCETCRYESLASYEGACDDCTDISGSPNNYEPKTEPQTDCIECPDIGEYPECYDRTKWKECPRRKGE